MLIERKLPFVGGPALNLYNGHPGAIARRGHGALGAAGGMLPGLDRRCPGRKCANGRPLPEVEIFAYGHLPRAALALLLTARAENRPKDDCQFCCLTTPTAWH